MMEQTARHIIFSGRVQGVGFRFTVLNLADRYKLTGHVRNLSNGAVEVVAQGPPELINDCVRDIQESFAGCIREMKAREVAVDLRITDFRITF